ncbi:MAG: hypothetical protein AMXMBFR66_28430 [Pseudomonadota bacterium]|nr:hypothetical protein [Rubrivivax sp.]
MLPAPTAWRAAAQRHAGLFAPLAPGARIALVARSAPQTMLLWETGAEGLAARCAPFAGYGASGADLVFAADDEALAALARALDGALFEALRACIRNGSIICYVLHRRAELEERGFDELLEAIGYAFMGACR